VAVTEQTSGSATGPDGPIAPLPCGRDAAPAWDRAEAGLPPDEHERDCPHCRAAIADAGRLHTVVHRMATEPVEPPPSVLERSMAAVRTEFRRRDLLVLESPYGPARLSRPAAAAVLRHAVDRMAGVRARSCRIEQTSGPAADVTITVAARFGVELASVTARVRQMVLAAGEQALGVRVRRVDIDVVDVFEDGVFEDGVFEDGPP
jgi:hypothetical protein